MEGVHFFSVSLSLCFVQLTLWCGKFTLWFAVCSAVQSRPKLALAPALASTDSKSNQRVQVFADAPSTPASAAASALLSDEQRSGAQPHATAHGAGGAWTELGSEAARRKENQPLTAKWNEHAAPYV